MNKLKWCCKAKNGIKLIESNENLSKEYMKEANNTLDNLLLVKGNWKLIMGYYACYNALYSILMKIGIKSEIHECSIELMNLIDGFSKEDIILIKNMKKDRIDVQYYLKDKKLEDTNKIKSFIIKCKEIIETLDIVEVRSKLEKEMENEEN